MDPTESISIRLPMCARMYQTQRQDGLIADTHAAFQLKHLEDIRQLSYMTPFEAGPWADPLPHRFTHTRWEHSVAAAWLARDLGTRIGLGVSQMQLAMVLELLHDHALPPGGDATKNLYRQHGRAKQVDEDHRFLDRFDRFEQNWLQLKRRYRLPENGRRQLGLGIKGLGIIGQMHDLCDTLSYLSLDNAAVVERRMFDPNVRHAAGVLQAIKLAQQNPGVRLLESARILHHTHDQRWLVFEDIESVGLLLEIRLLHWHGIYLSHRHRFFEQLYLDLLGRELMRRGRLSIQRMRDRDDSWLNGEIAAVFGTHEITERLTYLSDIGPEIHSFQTIEQALAYEQAAYAQGAFTLLHRRMEGPNGIKTNRYFVTQRGRAVPYFQARPEHHASLQRRNQAFYQRSAWVVYVIRSPVCVPAMIHAAWLKARQRWRNIQPSLSASA